LETRSGISSVHLLNNLNRHGTDSRISHIGGELPKSSKRNPFGFSGFKFKEIKTDGAPVMHLLGFMGRSISLGCCEGVRVFSDQ
jgi:hypothetical protein